MYFKAIHTSPGRGEGSIRGELRRQAEVSRCATSRWLWRLRNRTFQVRAPDVRRNEPPALAAISK